MDQQSKSAPVGQEDVLHLKELPGFSTGLYITVSVSFNMQKADLLSLFCLFICFILHCGCSFNPVWQKMKGKDERLAAAQNQTQAVQRMHSLCVTFCVFTICIIYSRVFMEALQQAVIFHIKTWAMFVCFLRDFYMH